MTNSVVVRLEKAAILRVIHQEPAFSEMFIAHLLGRTIRVKSDLVDQLFNSSEKRLARLLLLLANFGKESEPEPIIAKISQETLAEMIGTTRSRVSFFMNRFRKLGFIHYNGGIQVHSSLLVSFCTTSRTSISRPKYCAFCGRIGSEGSRPVEQSENVERRNLATFCPYSRVLPRIFTLCTAFRQVDVLTGYRANY